MITEKRQEILSLSLKRYKDIILAILQCGGDVDIIIELKGLVVCQSFNIGNTS
jgi:hypothetical protein